MLGIKEIIVGLILIGVVSFFGKSWILKMYRDFKGIKKDINKIDKELEE